MEKNNRRRYREAAQNALNGAAYDPKRLIFIHTGITAAVTLIANILIYVLDAQLSGATGLGGLGTRSILMTAQSILQLLPALLLPFWAMGYVFAIVNIAQGKPAGPAELGEGFFRFFPVLRFELLTALLYTLLMFAASQLGGTVFLWTPWAEPMMNAVLALMNDPQNAALEEAAYQMIMQASLPILLIVGAVFIGISLPFFYRFRMARLHLMANPDKGAWAAMRESAAMTRFHRMELLRLDLSFWWYYLLEALAAILAAGDGLLVLMGITLPLPEPVRYFAFPVLSLISQLLLHYRFKNEVYVTYAQVYEDLRQEI